MSAAPSYLLLSRHSVYYFRIVVPDVIRPLFPGREIRRSLQTRCRREALIRGRELLLQVQRLFTEAFQGRRPSLDLLCGAWEAGGKRLASWASWLRQQQLVSQPGAVIAEAKRQPEKPRQSPPQALIPDAPDLAPSFSKVVEEYLRQQAREGVAAKTIDDKRSVASLLVRVIGDHPINLITRKEAHLFRETALKLPPRIHQLQVSSIEQAMAEATSTISPTTFNNYVKNVTTVFVYAMREGYGSGPIPDIDIGGPLWRQTNSSLEGIRSGAVVEDGSSAGGFPKRPSPVTGSEGDGGWTTNNNVLGAVDVSHG